MLKDIDTSEIDKILKSEAESLKKDFNISKRQFRVFGYNTIFKENKSKLKKKEISREGALFPTMNPNLFGGLPSIFSCKPELRVRLSPGDVIFCFPNKTKKIKGDEDETIMKKYFRERNEEPPERCLTLVMIVIKKIDLKSIPKNLSFKYCKEKRNITKYSDCEYISPFAGDLKQVGDITAKFKNGIWEYAGEGNKPHNPEFINSIQSINNSQCEYGKYLSNLTENEDPKYSKLGCRSLQCKYYGKECEMKPGNWKYDILFKWGLLGSLKKSIPLEFRSFYLGSKGWSLERFAEEINSPKISKNIRWFKRDLLNEKGSEVLNKLRIKYKIK